MARLFYKFLCTFFITSYVFIGSGMEEPLREDLEDITLIGTTTHIVLDTPLSLDHETPSQPKERTDNQLSPEEPAQKYPGYYDLPIYKNYIWSQSSLLYPPKSSEISTIYSHESDMHHLMDCNKREEDNKREIQRNLTRLDPLYLPPEIGGRIDYDSEDLDAAVEYNRKKANQRKNNTFPSINNKNNQFDREKYVLELEEKRKQNIKNSLFDLISNNYDNEAFMESLEKNLQKTDSYKEYLETKTFIDNHPEVIKSRDNKPMHQRIETRVYSPTLNTVVKSSIEVEFKDPELQSNENFAETLDNNFGNKEKGQGSLKGTPKFSKEAIERVKQKYEDQRKEKELENTLNDMRDYRAEERASRKKARAQQSHNAGSYYAKEKESNFTLEDHRSLRQDLEQFKQETRVNSYQNYNPYNNYNNSSQVAQERHHVDPFEYKIYIATGHKSKNMIENEKIDEEERIAAWQHQQEDDEEEDMEELQQWIHAREREKVIDTMKHLHYGMRQCINSIHSELHMKAVQQAWDDAMKRLNYSIATQLLESYYGPIDPSQQTKYMNKFLIEASNARCGHIKDPSERIECINNVKIYQLNGDFNTINLNDIRYLSALEEFREELIQILLDYTRWVDNEYLPQLRQQPENNEHRRKMEFWAFTPEEHKHCVKVQKEINEKYKQLTKNLPWGVGLWENTFGYFTTEKSSRQILQENHKQELKKAIEDYIDEISAKKQALYEEQARLKQQEKNEEDKQAFAELSRPSEEYNAEKETVKESNDVKISNDSEKNDHTNITNSSHEAIDKANIILIKLRRNTYLKQIGIDHDEFNSFMGINSKQNTLHESIVQAVDDANSMHADVPEHIRETYNNLLKTTYELNKANFTDLAQELFELCDIASLLTEFGEEITDTICHPIQYLQRRLNEIKPTLYSPPHEDFDAYIKTIKQQNQKENTNEDLNHEEFQKDIKTVIEKTRVIIAEKESKYDPEFLARQKELRKLKIKECHRSFARFAIDLAFDCFVGAGINYASNLKGINNILIPYRLSDRIKKHLTEQRTGIKHKPDKSKNKLIGNKKKLVDNKAQDRTVKRTNFQPLTNKEARKIAKEWGYIETKNPPFNSHGRPTFRHPKTKEWISPDKDGHKGGIWKSFDDEGIRLGTLDKNGNRFAS